ncbi:MAG: hypothetical protein V7782_14240, partial [Psychromonas sp.]
MYKLLTAMLILSICSASTLADENDPCETPDSSETNIDVAYNYVNTKFCQPAIWFDSFFVDPRVTEDARAGTMIRWYQDITWEESESTEYDMKLSARVNLPRVTKKLKLVIESDDEDAYVDSLNEDTDSTVGLTYDIKAKADTSFTVKATLRPSVELRYRYTEVWNEQTLTRFTQKIYQKKKVTGVSSHIDLDYSINQIFLIRWGGVAKYESDIKNVELATG